jgi:hypothetical protein
VVFLVVLTIFGIQSHGYEVSKFLRDLGKEKEGKKQSEGP